MNYSLYSVFDRVAGLFSEPFIQNSDATAIRFFRYRMSQSAMVSADCVLYRLGSYDTSTGTIVPYANPEFVENYIEEVKQ